MAKINFLTGIAALLFFSCKKDIPETEVSLAEFQPQPGFLIQCVAAEPLLDTPVQMVFDEKNRIWAVEMPGYMPNADGLGEDGPVGKIVILEDRDGDGRMDTRLVFLDHLVMPRALALVHGGLLYAEPPSLFFVEIKGDRPGQRTLVDSTYAPGLNPEYQANGLLSNVDNWIYSAGSDKRYRLRNGQWEVEKTSFRGQWGITHDEWGRLFYNNNSVQIMGDHVLPGLLGYGPSRALGQVLCHDQRVWPAHPTLVNRGYEPGELDSLGRLQKTTSACGPALYLGEQFPREFYGNAFVCIPEANLVKRNVLHDDKQGRAVARQAYEGREFLTSTDATFRPVNLTTGPDGCLYVTDMRRGLIQHSAYLTQYLKTESQRLGLDTFTGRGRIYRICFEGKPPTVSLNFAKTSSSQLVKLLAHPDGHVRLKAQQTLVERNENVTVEALQTLVGDLSDKTAAVHALWALEGMGRLTDDALLTALNFQNRPLMEAALTMLPEYRPQNAGQFRQLFIEVWEPEMLPQSTLRYWLAVLPRLDFLPETESFAILPAVLKTASTDTLLCEAALGGLVGKETAFREFLLRQQPTIERNLLISKLLEQTILKNNQTEIRSSDLFANTDERTAGLQLYRQYCAACHRPDGEGTPNLAPPLLGSSVVNGPMEKLSEVIWRGKTGPVLVDGRWVNFKEPMAAFRDNPAWNEEMLKAVTAFVRNAFGGN